MIIAIFSSMLMLVCGLPGTGKSTIANNLARKLRATVLRTDVVRKEVIQKPTYTEEEKALVYKITFLIATYLLRSGRNVILDGTFYKKALREEVYKISRDTRSRLEIVECVCPEDIIQKRMGGRFERPRGPSDADYGVYKKIKEEFEPIDREHIVVDTSKTLSENLKEISEGLRKRWHAPRPS